MNEGAPQEERNSLREVETLSPELTQELEDAKTKLLAASKIRQKAGKSYQFTNAIDGNFPLRMQYGQLREEIKRLGRLHDAGEQLDEADYSRLVKIQAAFNRSYEKVLQYAKEYDIDIPEPEMNPEPTRKVAVSSSTTGEESVNEAPEDAIITSTMKSNPESAPTKPQLAADIYENSPNDVSGAASVEPASAPPAESEKESEKSLDTETKQTLLAALDRYETNIEKFRSTLTNQAVDKHPAYQEFTRRTQQFRSLLDGSWKEADTIVTQLVKKEQLRIDALYKELQSDLQTQRDQFEASVGPELAAMRDAQGEVTNTEADKSPKKTGWFHPAYRRAHNAATPPDSTEVTTSAPDDVNQLTPDTQVDQGDTENQQSSEVSDIGAWPTDPDQVPEFKPERQQVLHTEAQPDASNTFTENENTTKIDSNPEGTATSTVERTEPAATILGLELPPSGQVGSSAAFMLREEIGRIMLHMNKKAGSDAKKAVHEAWSVVASMSPHGLSPLQREQLIAIAPRLPEIDKVTGEIESARWKKLNFALPSLQEKIAKADDVTKSNWKRRGTKTLLAALAFIAVPEKMKDSEPVEPNTVLAQETVDGDMLHTDTLAEKIPPYVTDSTPFVPDAAITNRGTPEAPTKGPGRVYESPTPVHTENFDDANDTTSETSPEVTVTSTTDEAPAGQEARLSLPPVEQLLDTMFERSEIEYIFQPGSKINTVSEALWETWKRNSDVLEIDQPLSKAAFLRTMYDVIDETEQNPAVHEALTKRMQIKSGDIHKVFVNERIDLKPLLEKMSAKLKAVTPSVSSVEASPVQVDTPNEENTPTEVDTDSELIPENIFENLISGSTSANEQTVQSILAMTWDIGTIKGGNLLEVGYKNKEEFIQAGQTIFNELARNPAAYPQLLEDMNLSSVDEFAQEKIEPKRNVNLKPLYKIMAERLEQQNKS